MKANLVLKAIFAALILAAVVLGYRNVVVPALDDVAEATFRREVETYLAEIEQPLVESFYDWSLTSPHTKFRKENEHEKMQLIVRMDLLRGASASNWQVKDDWGKVHHDLLREIRDNAIWSAGQDLGRKPSLITEDDLNRYCPEGWGKRVRAERVHTELDQACSSWNGALSARRSRFAYNRVEMDGLLKDFGVKKRRLPSQW